MGDCDKIPADAWEQLPQPVWPALQKSEGVPDFVELGGVHLSGFLCFDGDFAGITCCCAHRSALASEFFCCKNRLVANFQAWVAGCTDACTSLCTGAKHLRSAQFGRLFCSDTPPCNPLQLLLSLSTCAALEEHSEL